MYALLKFLGTYGLVLIMGAEAALAGLRLASDRPAGRAAVDAVLTLLFLTASLAMLAGIRRRKRRDAGL